MTTEKIIKINQLANNFNSKNPGLSVERLHNCFIDIKADYKEFCNDIKNTKLEDNQLIELETISNFDKFVILDASFLNHLGLIDLAAYETKLKECKNKKQILSTAEQFGRDVLNTIKQYQNELVVNRSMLLKKTVKNDAFQPLPNSIINLYNDYNKIVNAY